MVGILQGGRKRMEIRNTMVPNCIVEFTGKTFFVVDIFDRIRSDSPEGESRGKRSCGCSGTTGKACARNFTDRFY